MQKTLFGIVLVLMVLLIAACSTITTPRKITENPVGSKVGEATATYLGGPISYGGVTMMPPCISGRNGISDAAAAGGVTKIATVEQRIEKSLFITKITTIVTGN